MDNSEDHHICRRVQHDGACRGMNPGLTSFCRRNRSPHAMRTAAVAVGRSHPQSGLQGPLKARGREKRREARAFERLLFARSLARRSTRPIWGQSTLSPFLPFVLSIFHPSPLACCPLFRDHRRARGREGGGARRAPVPLHPRHSVFAAPSSGQRRTPFRATKIYFLSRSTGFFMMSFPA